MTNISHIKHDNIDKNERIITLNSESVNNFNPCINGNDVMIGEGVLLNAAQFNGTIIVATIDKDMSVKNLKKLR